MSAHASPLPPFQVDLQPSGIRFEALPGHSLLKSALDQGWRLPSSCRNGTCRSCICKLVSGRVRYLVEWPGLSAEEKAEGWILPCVAVADGDLVIDAPLAGSVFGAT
jgi:ferredoxin